MTTDTTQRDHVIQIAKTKNDIAYSKTKNIKDPWYKVQALAAVARYNKEKAVKYCNEAIKISKTCSDHYQVAAVQSWVIAALAETGNIKEASNLLNKTLVDSQLILPNASKAEALYLLIQAAYKINAKSFSLVYETIQKEISGDQNWRCKRVVKNANNLLNKTLCPREFF